MLDNRTVLGKTGDGRDAIANRTHNLNPRQRALLISINGVTDVAGLIGRFGGGTPEAATGLIESLVERGLAAPLAAPSGDDPAASSARRASQAGSSPAPVAANTAHGSDPLVERTPSAPAQLAPRPGAGAPVERAPTDSLAGVDWRELQQRAGDSLHAAMGADADLLAMRLARSRSEAEFFSHFERAVDLVGAARGDAAARAFQREVAGQG